MLKPSLLKRLMGLVYVSSLVPLLGIVGPVDKLGCKLAIFSQPLKYIYMYISKLNA